MRSRGSFLFITLEIASLTILLNIVKKIKGRGWLRLIHTGIYFLCAGKKYCNTEKYSHGKVSPDPNKMSKLKLLLKNMFHSSRFPGTSGVPMNDSACMRSFG